MYICVCVCTVNIWNDDYAQATEFSTHERMFLWKCRYFFQTENVSARGVLKPPIFGFMPNALTTELSGPNIFLSV